MSADTPEAKQPCANDGAETDAAPAAAERQKDPLRSSQFRTLLAGWTLANFADSLLVLILAVWVKDLTGSAVFGGTTLALLGLPAIASPFIGYLTDRVSRRIMLAVACAIGAAALLPLFWVNHADQVWLIYVCATIYGTVAYVSGACQSGILKDTLPEEHLGRANSTLSTIDHVLRIVLPILGAGVYAWVGVAPLLAAAAATFLGAAIIFVFVKVTESSVEATTEPYGKALVAGFQHLFGTQPVGSLAWGLLVAMAAVGLLNGTVFAILDHFNMPAAWLGPLTVGQGLGGVVAGLCAPKLMDRFGRVTVCAAGIIILAVSFLPLAGTSVVLAVISQAVTGFAVTASIIAFITERQIVTPERLQGRAATASQVILNLPSVVVTAGAAAAITVIDYRILVVTSAAILLSVGLIVLRRRHQTSNDTAPKPAA